MLFYSEIDEEHNSPLTISRPRTTLWHNIQDDLVYSLEGQTWLSRAEDESSGVWTIQDNLIFKINKLALIPSSKFISVVMAKYINCQLMKESKKLFTTFVGNFFCHNLLQQWKCLLPSVPLTNKINERTLTLHGCYNPFLFQTIFESKSPWTLLMVFQRFMAKHRCWWWSISCLSILTSFGPSIYYTATSVAMMFYAIIVKLILEDIVSDRDSFFTIFFLKKTFSAL